MSYKCDICSTMMASKESGFVFDRNRVLSSPGYWDYVFRDATDPFMSRMFTEDATGLAVQQLLMSDTGYIICSSCKEMLQRDTDKAKEYRIEPWFTSMQVKDFKATDRAQAKEQLQATLITIGTVYERKSGKWPSFVARDEFDARAKRWASPSGSSTSARADAPPAPKPNSTTRAPSPVASSTLEPAVESSKRGTIANDRKWWQFWK
jgi:hypothetical protein